MASVATSAVTPTAASTPPSTSTATPSGSPHSALRSHVEAITSSTVLVRPNVKLASALPPITDAGFTGATNRRESVPPSRSSSRPRTPNSTAKNRKNTAMPIAKNVDSDVA